jgi:hypothetical protein
MKEHSKDCRASNPKAWSHPYCSCGFEQFLAGMEAAAAIVDDSDVVECGSGYMRCDDGRGTLVAARNAIRAEIRGGT